MKVNGTGSWCVLEEYVKDNCYARFDTALGKTRNGMECIGLEWNGLDWIGMEWNSILS